MMKAKGGHQNKLMKFLTMPIKALAKARDFYVKSMNNYADKMNYGVATGLGSGPYSVPRSFSSTAVRDSHGDDDYRELVRAASTNTLGKRLGAVDLNAAFGGTTSNLGLLKKEHELQNKGMNNIKRVPRSASVGMAKIEEEKACEFDDGEEVSSKKELLGKEGKDKKFGLFPRSRSYAVGGAKRAIPSAFA